MSQQPMVKTITEPVLCIHMEQMVTDRGYQRDLRTGLWLVKMCLGPTREALQLHCGKLVPASSPTCFSCHSSTFGPAPDNVIELTSCHRRCRNCKWVTPGCDTKQCGYCNSSNLTLLPPAINIDVYGWRLAQPR